METPKKSVVIIGGGGGGARVARELSAKLDASKYTLTLIDKRDVGVYMIAAARLSVESPDNLDKNALLPFDHVFVKGNGKFIQGKVTAIDKSVATGGAVVLENGNKVPYDLLVLAAGSRWEGPFNFPDNAEAIAEFIKNNQAQVQAAQKIIIAGGGAVGVEISGEIKTTYPTKTVTIVQGDSSLLNSVYPMKYRKAVEDAVTAIGTQLVLDDFVDEFPPPGSTTLKTRNGKPLEADLVIPARGPRPNTDFIVASLGSDVVDDKGYVKVKKTLQLVSHSDIFAVGDIVDIKEQKQSAKAQGHSKVVAANVLRLLQGSSSSLQEYKGIPELIALTNGKNGGRGYIPFLWGLVTGDWMMRMIKSRSLFLSMYKGYMGY